MREWWKSRLLGISFSGWGRMADVFDEVRENADLISPVTKRQKREAAYVSIRSLFLYQFLSGKAAPLT